MSRALRRAIVVAVVFSIGGCKRSRSQDAITHPDDPAQVPAHTAHATRAKLHRDDPRVAEIVSNGGGFCARREDGRLSCWGNRSFGPYLGDAAVPREMEVRDVDEDE